MSTQPDAVNTSVEHGVWGEEVAVEFLRIHGYQIIDRNVRPCSRDRRLEIDIIAYDRMYDTMVFVEVKQHKSHSVYDARLRGVDKRKKALLRRACRTWLMKQCWQSGYRFDVIEVYGEPYSPVKAEIDHIPNVQMFVPGENFVNWAT